MLNPEGGSQVRLTPGGKITERFTRYSDTQVLYEFEVNDPRFTARCGRARSA